MQSLAPATPCPPHLLLRRLALRARHALGRALERQRTRRALALLDEAALSDIGLTRAEALRESARPFWR